MRHCFIKMRILSIFLISMIPFSGFGREALNDAEIAEVMEVCQKIRFDFAQVAFKKASRHEVKDFAHYIMTDYKEDLSPIPTFAKNQNQSARDIKKNIDVMTSQLKKLKGKEFDQTYLQTQMDLHKRLIKNFEESLIPLAKNPELKKALTKVQSQMEDYVGDTLDAYISINK